MSPPNFGVSLRPDGLSVALNPNSVKLSVSRGANGAILTVEGCGVVLRCALPADARRHLAGLLADPDAPGGTTAPISPEASRAAVAGAGQEAA